MSGLIPSYNDGPKCETAGQLSKPLRRPTLTEILEDRVLNLKHQVEENETALTALKANPEVEKVFNLLQRVI